LTIANERMENPALTGPVIETFAATDGYAFSFRRYRPTGPPRGSMVCLHGIQSHGGWYDFSCRRFCDAGYEVFFPDRRGSGLNQAHRGDAPSYERLLRDVEEFLGAHAPRSSGRPVFLQAVSWGGKLAVALQRWKPGLIDGLVLLCPGFFPRVGLTVQRRLQVLLAALTMPTRQFPIPLNDPRLFTATPRWLEFLRADTLALHQASARFLVQSALLDYYLRGSPAFVTVPTLLLLAGRDRVIRNDLTHRFFHRLAALDKNVLTYGEAEHTLEFEPEPQWFAAEIVRWLDRQSQSPVRRAVE
jgi:alpha-beta hydrolase superfamily lysophospholipase